MSKYFISHASEDRSFVENELLELLEALGIDYWYSKEDIKTGEQWEKSIKQALETCAGLILVMSPNSETSEWIQDEVHWALENRPGLVIPVLFKSCEPSNIHIRLSRIQHADFSSSDNIGRNKLIALLRDLEHKSKSRIGAIQGRWEGKIFQEPGPSGIKSDKYISIHLQIENKDSIKGSVTYTHSERGDIYFGITGGLLYERFIQLSYRSLDPGVLQFGSSIAELDPTGNVIKGKILGFGPRSQSVVFGSFIANKSQ